jgi:hypothetical protein
MILAVYLTSIYFILPRFMANRKPLDVTAVIRCYNAFQIIACIACVVLYFRYGFTLSYMWKCTDGVYENLPKLAELHWFILMVKFAELFETILFVLRKKNEQVSFLHVFHHATTVTIVWLVVRHSNRMMDAFVGFINCFVHIIMYCYYLMSSYEVCKSTVARLKPLITVVQIVQLIAIIGHCIVATRADCGVNHFLYYLHMGNVAFMVFMFVQFFVKNYVRGVKSATK